ncbi:MAG: trehalose 6-phosphate synthase/phosphatase, partial [Bryobacterales bacterium]|nr:trehalose 6-phosphate synthase/phosphatase [Bryobacterales bacterium]
MNARAAATPRPLFDHLSDIGPTLSAASRIFLFLDFDGTLAPIVEVPEAASMAPEIRQLLIRLSRKWRFSVGIISGRSLADLQDRVALPGLTYAGDHGFAIHGPGLNFVEPTAAERRGLLRNVSRELENRLDHIDGVRVEQKALTASVHYRQARLGDLEQIRGIVSETVGQTGELFRVTRGLKVLEIRPRVNWNKGKAVRWILEGCGHPEALPIYVGDDVTDEDAFRALPTGVTVRIGRHAETLA